MCTHAIPHVAHTKLCVFSFPKNDTSSNDTGSCNFLDRCSDAKCPYVHYVLDDPRANEESALCLRRDRLEIMPKLNPDEMRRVLSTTGPLLPISAIQADLRGFALEKVCGGGGGDNDEGRRRGGGEFRAVLIDPPWSISMALPFPSLRDGEIENLKIPAVLDRTRACYVFLWATQRKTPLAREILQKWGSRAGMRVVTHDLVWVKLNQLNRLVSAGRTGYYFNHAKETCVVGVYYPIVDRQGRGIDEEEEENEKKENEEGSENNNDNDTLNSFPFKDSDVICAKVREVSRKPDEIYGIIERLVGSNSKKLELFARNWNVSSARRYQNWVCIGNQIQKTVIMDDEISKKFDREYPEFAPAATKSKE